MIIAIITSMVVDKHKGDAYEESGFFRMDVKMSLQRARASGDPQGYFNHTIAKYLLHCKQATGLPFHENLWRVQFTQFAQTHFNVPEDILI